MFLGNRTKTLKILRKTTKSFATDPEIPTISEYCLKTTYPPLLGRQRMSYKARSSVHATSMPP